MRVRRFLAQFERKPEGILRWRRRYLDSSGDGHNLRGIFVSSRRASNNPKLVSLQVS